MKKCFLSLFPIAAFALASGQTSIGSWQSFSGSTGELPEVTVLESDPLHITVEVDIPGFWLYDFPAGGSNWDRVSLPQCYPQGDIGLPELPSVPRLFALPYGTEAVVTIEEVNSTIYSNMDILPLQTPEIDMDHDPYPFRINEEFYQGNESYPGSLVYVDNEAIWGGLNIARLVVNPFIYNPATGDLEVVQSITVRVDFNGPAGELSKPVSPSMVPAMRRSVINWSTFENAADPIDGQRDDGVEYVFVCTEGNVGVVEELFQTHHYLGLHTRVETLTTPATTAAIKAAITNNYVSGVTRFACIVGTHAELPSYTWEGRVGDYWYACLEGSDYYPEIAVGRLTGNSMQIAHQVDKIIDGYMNYSFDDARTTDITPSETVLAAHSEQYPLKYTQCCNEIAAYPYSLCDVTFTKVYPPEGGTAADVSNAINDEIGTVGYRGHGNATSWSWSPGWGSSNINALTNTFMPHVFNIACSCGDYTGSSTCLAESWQWADNGASGNLAATTSSYTIPNHDYMKETYKNLYDFGVFRIGEAIMVATAWIVTNHGSLGIDNAQMYIWFGDAGIDTWTFDTVDEPYFLLISHPAELLPGNQDITITVTDGTSPVELVNVTITDGVDNYGDGMTFYEEGLTDASGEVTLNVTVPASGTVYFGAFLHDYSYDIKYVVVGTGVGDSEGLTPVFTFDRPSPNPISVSASMGFSVPSAGRVEIAVYDVSGRMVQTILDGVIESGAHTLEWTPGTEISNGVYFVRLSTEAGTLTRQAMVIR